ncbi:MAG: integrase DNA-binding domain-containing protein [Streptococcus sp.]
MSSAKRRDNLETVSYTEERAKDKTAGTLHKYVDALGKTKYVYAWKLLPTDKTPAGKREDLSLREKELSS